MGEAGWLVSKHLSIPILMMNNAVGLLQAALQAQIAGVAWKLKQIHTGFQNERLVGIELDWHLWIGIAKNVCYSSEQKIHLYHNNGVIAGTGTKQFIR